MNRWKAALPPVAAVLVVAAPAAAQTIPFADTEDATLSRIEVGEGDVHPVASIDLRNGDYARGGYDDDDAGLGRIPVHLALGGAVVLQRRRDGEAALFAIGQSSNGFHAPRRDERARPRFWYESNTLIGLAWRPTKDVDAAVTYAIKTSPNGVAATTHEASVTFLYSADDPVGRLKPRLAVTRRTRGNGGVYMIAGIAPSIDLSDREDGAVLSLPVTAGMGWRGFYGGGSGDRAYGSGGLAVTQPVRMGDARASLQAEMSVLMRDGGLRRLDAPGGTTAAVIPYATVSFAVAW